MLLEKSNSLSKMPVCYPFATGLAGGFPAPAAKLEKVGSGTQVFG